MGEGSEANERRDRRALLVLGMQRDLMPHGALAVPGAEELWPAINHYVATFERAGDPIYFARDWHPADHCSFVAQGGRWPPHCVAGTAGAEVVREVRVPDGATIVSKGTECAHEAYSAFEGTALSRQLRAHEVTDLWIAGVPAEYDVRATVLDALKTGFAVTVLVDSVRALEERPGGAARAFDEMLAAGARVHTWARSGRHVARSRALSRNPPP